jgi:hypothetical protein
MPMRYANEEDVLAMLMLEDSSDEYDGLVRLENGLCDVFDHKIGTSFGTTPVAETRSVNAGSIANMSLYWPTTWSAFWVYGSTRLLLDTPVRSVTGITTGGTWNGTAWVDGDTVLTADYRLTNHTSQGYYAIDHEAGTWDGVVRITGIWADQVTATVPDDVTQALTEITVKEWHRRHASPAGEIGPDGISITPGNPWTLSYIRETIDKYTVIEVLA